jgi:hypothetical protein
MKAFSVTMPWFFQAEPGHFGIQFAPAVQPAVRADARGRLADKRQIAEKCT